MNTEDANKIIQDYKQALAKGTVGDTILRKISRLPYSKGKIKYAYFTLIEEICNKNGKMPSAVRDELVEEYKKLNTFIDDETAEKYAKNYQAWQSLKSDPFRKKKDESFIKQYLAFTHVIQGKEIFDELNDFIEELTDGKK